MAEAQHSPIQIDWADQKNLRSIVERIGWVIVTLLVTLGLISIFNRSYMVLTALANPDLQQNGFDIRYVEHPIASLLHLLPALLIALLGPLQFIRKFRKHYPAAHRWNGRIYLICGTIGAFSGFYVGVFYPFSGLSGPGFNEAAATAFFASYVLFSLYKAYTSVRVRNFAQHREWMIRSWGLMLAIATERTLLGIFAATTDVELAVLFGTTFWLAGVINIAASEYWIHLTRTPGNGVRHWKEMDQRAA